MTDISFQQESGVFNYRVAGVWRMNNHVLIHKSIHKGNWALPGGRVQLMETSKESLTREFQEELGVEIKVKNLLWTTENFFHFDGKAFHEIGLYYEVVVPSETVIRAETFSGLEEDRKDLIYKWVPITELTQYTIQPDFLVDALQNLSPHPEHIVIR